MGPDTPLRVLYAPAETHPSFRADVAVLFGKYLPRLGVHSDLLTLHAVDPVPPWGGGECLTRLGPPRGARRHLLSVLNDVRMLWLARRGYRCVIVRDKSLGALLGLVAARLAGIPFVYWMSFPMVEAWAVFARERRHEVGWSRWLAAKWRATVLRRLLYRVVLPRARHVFVQSDTMLAEMASKGFDPARMSAVPMGIDTEALPRSAPLADQTASPHESIAPTFVYLGTLNRLRQPELMIDALAILRSRGVSARLLLIGDAEEAADRQWLRDRVKQRGLDSWVEFTGWLPALEAQGRGAAAVAGLSAIPRSEILEVSSPTKAVEYFHLGLPVIANDQPDQAAVMAAAGGVCAPLTAEGFADAMQDVLERPEHHRHIAQRGQEWVRQERSYAVLAERVAGRLRACL